MQLLLYNFHYQNPGDPREFTLLMKFILTTMFQLSN